MCIIPGPISSVTNTKLFVLPNRDKTKQMTFYMNSVETPDENLMILPVPNPQTLELHRFPAKKLFSQLRDSVHSTERGSSFYYDTMYLSRSASLAAPLPVFDYGSYLVSIAETIEDLYRLKADVFDLPSDMYKFFAEHYSREFGYLCCVLKPNVKDYEPVCYSHALHSNGKLFVPTLHYHNHDGKIETDAADWDHYIYSMGTLEVANFGFRSASENKVLWKRFPEEFKKDVNEPVRCAKITGNQKNRDIAFALA
jgi:hypothetical protein